eukprot:170141-Prymnesium_polylepis.1
MIIASRRRVLACGSMCPRMRAWPWAWHEIALFALHEIALHRWPMAYYLRPVEPFKSTAFLTTCSKSSKLT